MNFRWRNIRIIWLTQIQCSKEDIMLNLVVKPVSHSIQIAHLNPIKSIRKYLCNTIKM